MIEITAPLPPSLTNSAKGRSRHWRALEREKGAYWLKLDSLVLTRALPRTPAVPLRQVDATAHLYLWNPMDDGNAMARLKWLEDWLVRRGYLADDSRKHLRYTGIPEQTIDRKRPRVVLTLTARSA